MSPHISLTTQTWGGGIVCRRRHRGREEERVATISQPVRSSPSRPRCRAWELYWTTRMVYVASSSGISDRGPRDSSPSQKCATEPLHAAGPHRHLVIPVRPYLFVYRKFWHVTLFVIASFVSPRVGYLSWIFSDAVDPSSPWATL